MMRSWVSVPVLSVQRTSIAPRFWIALRRFTITFLRDMAIAPFARFTVTIIGSISGVRPTATATAKSSASNQSCLVRPLIRELLARIPALSLNSEALSLAPKMDFRRSHHQMRAYPCARPREVSGTPM
jgi:hypothetical protein